jgi:hypothetical protein
VKRLEVFGQMFETIKNALSVVDKGYLNQIREGNVRNHEFVRVEGNNIALGTTFGELSTLYTAGYGNWPADGTAGVVLVSDSVNDDANGSGARTVTIRGHDGNSVAVEETVTMDGTTPVAVTSQLFFRVHELEVATSGPGLANAGKITASVGGTDIIALQDGHSRSTEGRHHVAAGYTMYLQDAEGSSVGTNKNATFHLFTRNTTVASSPFVLQQIWQSQNGGFTPNGKIPGIPEKHDVIIIVSGTASSSVAAGSLQGWIEQ